jgi:hypothetical protein
MRARLASRSKKTSEFGQARGKVVESLGQVSHEALHAG